MLSTLIHFFDGIIARVSTEKLAPIPGKYLLSLLSAVEFLHAQGDVLEGSMA